MYVFYRFAVCILVCVLCLLAICVRDDVPLPSFVWSAGRVILYQQGDGNGGHRDEPFVLSLFRVRARGKGTMRGSGLTSKTLRVCMRGHCGTQTDTNPRQWGVSWHTQVGVRGGGGGSMTLW